MEDLALDIKMKQLPLDMRREVTDFVDFLLNKYQARRVVKPRAGCMKGTVIWMSDDFNDLLDDFKDYMQ
jgi:hypothetical protein